MFQQIFTDLLRRLLGRFFGDAQERKHDERKMSFKFFFCLLQNGLFGCNRHPVKGLYGGTYGRRKLLFNHCAT